MSEPEPPKPYVSRIDRRAAITWMGVAALTAGAAGGLAVYGHKGDIEPPKAKGYGTDPNLMNPAKAPWPRILTKGQLQTAALLCDFILPATATAPSASALGVPDFIDEWISAPYPNQAKDRPVIVAGLKWVEKEAKHRHGEKLLHLAAADRTALLQALAVKPTDPAMEKPHTFFRRFRALTAGAYFTTDVGFKEIGYIGNVAMASYPGPSPDVKAALDAQLQKLGLLGAKA